jgi:hypothetical protein
MEKITAFVITVATTMLLYPLCYDWAREILDLQIWDSILDGLEKAKDLFDKLIGNDKK